MGALYSLQGDNFGTRFFKKTVNMIMFSLVTVDRESKLKILDKGMQSLKHLLPAFAVIFRSVLFQQLNINGVMTLVFVERQ
jgi:hypothetical protein